MRRGLVLLARAPTPGHGKTRLRGGLPGPQVDALAAAFLEDTIGWAETVPAHLLIAHDGPAERLPRCAADRVLQPDGGLGTRIDAALASAFASGIDAAVLIGSDSPDLPAELLAACFDGLRHAPATLIPAADGGWVAMGARTPLDGCLAGVGWSTERTLAATIDALTTVGRPPMILDPWYDIDEAASLDRLRMSLDVDPARAPRTARVLEDSRRGIWFPDGRVDDEKARRHTHRHLTEPSQEPAHASPRMGAAGSRGIFRHPARLLPAVGS